MNAGAIAEMQALDPDAVLVKGDLTDRGTDEEYQAFVDAYTQLGARMHHARGNHDAMVSDQIAVNAPRAIELSGVTLAVLDTVRPGVEHGRITGDQLEWLDELAAASTTPVLVFGHHHPWDPSSTERNDHYFGINPDDSEALCRVIARREAIGGYFAGHTHRNRVRRFEAGAQRSDRRGRVREGLSRARGRSTVCTKAATPSSCAASRRRPRWRGPSKLAACSQACTATTRWAGKATAASRRCGKSSIRFAGHGEVSGTTSKGRPRERAPFDDRSGGMRASSLPAAAAARSPGARTRRRRSPKSIPNVTITATDFAFAMPAEIPSGYVNVTLDNKGKEGHQVGFVKLGSLTYAQFKAASGKTNIKAVKPDTHLRRRSQRRRPRRIDERDREARPGPLRRRLPHPGQRGRQAARRARHDRQGERRDDRRVRRRPAGDQLDDHVARVLVRRAQGLRRQGHGRVSNQGAQVHELVIVKLAPGKTVNDAKAFFLTPPGTPPPAGPPPFESIPGMGGITGLSSHQNAWLDMDLTPGNYVLICFFPDTSQEPELPHALAAWSRSSRSSKRAPS